MNKRIFFDKTLVKFLLVGVCNTLVGSAVMFALYNFGGMSYWIASAANYIVGGAVSFFLNKYFTFQARGWSWKQVARFALNLAICYLLAYGMAKPLVELLFTSQPIRVQENAAMLAGICLYTVLNYFGQRWFAFKGDAT